MAGGVITSEGMFLGERLGRNELAGLLTPESVLGGTEGRGITGSRSGAIGTGAIRTGERSAAGLIFGGGWVGRGWVGGGSAGRTVSFAGAPAAPGFGGRSKLRNN